jgi:hypothetical protein
MHDTYFDAKWHKRLRRGVAQTRERTEEEEQPPEDKLAAAFDAPTRAN